MGCISSKIVTRSRSFQEELSFSLKRRTNGFPALEDLFSRKNDGDQILALISTANTVAKKLKAVEHHHKITTPTDSGNQSGESMSPETINSWELMSGLEQEEEEEDSLVSKSKRFHTVEEYDALVAGSSVAMESEVSTSKNELGCVTESRKLQASGKGFRRKAMAKELAPLKPPSFEFKSTGSLREWIEGGGQVFSPGSYVTPKFGNLDKDAPESKGREEDYECSVFYPELVSDLEEAMAQLTMEEEHILKQIIEGLGKLDQDYECKEVVTQMYM